MKEDGKRILRFGEFELDTSRRLLRAIDGERVDLTPRVFDTLAYLVKRAGEDISKQELLDAVWPGVVVEENNLTQAISALRRALHEAPRENRYIVTVPGRGYRFVADVRPAIDDANDSPAAGRHDAARRRWPTYAIAAAAFVVVVVAAGIRLLSGNGDVPQPASTIELTGQRLVAPGTANQRQPTLSPDGSRVAFVSDAGGSDQVYVKNLNVGKPEAITDLEGGVASPAWSPRDDRIVFHRPGAGGIWTVGVRGDPAPRPLIDHGSNPRFSPDGELIVYEHEGEILLADRHGAGAVAVPGSRTRDWRWAQLAPDFSPDGSEIVFFRSENGPIGDYWILPAAGGDPRQLTRDNAEAGRPNWAADGYIYFASERAGTRTIWRIGAQGGPLQPVTSSVGLDDDVVVSANANRIVYANTRAETRFMLREHDSEQAVEVYRSRSKSSFPRVSRDGRRIVFFQKVHPTEQIFVMNVGDWRVDQLTETGRGERRIMPRWADRDARILFYEMFPDGRGMSLRAVRADGGPSEVVFREFNWATNMDVEWSPDGDRAVYIRRDPTAWDDWTRSQIVIRDTETGNESEPEWPIIFAPSWSADGRRILGTSEDRVLVCALGTNACSPLHNFAGHYDAPDINQSIGRYAQWSRDETRVFFGLASATPGFVDLWVVDADGSNARQLFSYGPIDPIDGRFQVLDGDRILWNELVQSQQTELWLADIIRIDNGA